MIHTIDLVIIGLYFILVLFIGLRVALKTKSSEDLFLSGRSLSWGVIGLSLFASNISSTTLVGLAGAAYTTGIANAVYEFGAGIPFIVLAFIFVPLYITSKITTIPEFLEHRFDRRSRTFFSAVTIIVSIIVDTAGGLYAGAIVLQTFFPSIVLWQTCFVLAIIAGCYTAFGGLKAVVYTDSIQAIILIIGCSVLSYQLFSELNFSWTQLVDTIPENHLSVVLPADDSNLPWPGLILGVPFLGFWYIATNQYITQRVLGAKNIQHARWGIMLGSALKLLPFFIMVLPGAMMLAIMPGLENGDMVFPTAVLHYLPVGLVGLVLAGLISAIMSSVDSTLNSASTLIVFDFIKTRRPNISTKATILYGRIATGVFMLIAASWAPMIVSFGGLWSYLQQMFSIIVPPIIVLFLVGVFYKRGNGSGAFWTLVLGTSLGIIFFVLAQLDLWQQHYLITLGLVIGLSSVIFIVVSLKSPPPSPEVIKRYTFHWSLLNIENTHLAWYQDYRYHSVLIILAISCMYIWLW